MKNKWYAVLLLTLGIGVFPLSAWADAVKAPAAAAQPAKAESHAKDEKKATEEVRDKAEAQTEKEEIGEANTENAAEDKKSEKAEEKKEEKKEEPLLPIDGRPLSEEDFTLLDISLGGSLDAVKGRNGGAKEIRRGSLADTYVWDDLTVRVHPDFLDTYNHRDDISLGTLPPSGVTAWEITGGELTTTRGIHVGSKRENVLRAYGRPARISWDGEKDTFYLIYERIEENLIFAISQDMVKSIRASLDENIKPVSVKPAGDVLPDADFSLAGLTIHHIFKDYSFQEWEKKITNPDEEAWYYKGYAVRMTPKEKLIRGFFLTDSRMITPRGLSLGDASSTAELLYGAPGKLEMDTRDGMPRTASIYFSKGEENVLIIYLKDKRVDGIAVAENPQHKGNTPE